MPFIRTARILSLPLLILLNGCGGGGDDGDTNPEPPVDIIDETIKISGDYAVERLGTGVDKNIVISLGSTPKDLYILLSNYSQTSSDSTSELSHDRKLQNEQVTAKSSKIAVSSPVKHAPEHIARFKEQINGTLHEEDEDTLLDIRSKITERSASIVGTNENFCTDITSSGVCTVSIAATLKSVTSSSTPLGTKTLNVWVEDDSFGSGCRKRNCVTQDMVDILANQFLQDGDSNDIYEWVTNIYGEEWGTHTFTELISPTNTIDILLTDIDKDNSTTGGVIGFFYPKDNFLQSIYSGSNEKIMFYIDSVLYATGEDGWDINDFWPKETISTLAHEFVHMIQFYQKDIHLSSYTDTWLDEMLAETTEDLIATKIQHTGPRGVDYLDGSAGDPDNPNGRYPLFNQTNTLSLTQWGYTLADYSHVNAFGTFLTRNYGGAALLHGIMHNSYTDEQAVVSAVNALGASKNFNDLLREWGVAVVLSDLLSPYDLPTYNTGDFSYSMYDATTYDMGSINFFNYSPQPSVYSFIDTVSAQANYYYMIGENLTGDVTLTLNLASQTEATLIAK